MSFQNNLTMKFGYLHPCLCKEVLAGDTWHLDASFGLRFLPTFFPLQTKMKAQIDFFYVRNRNLWDGFKNYLYMTGSPDAFPTLSSAQRFAQLKTGSLGDYLGLPSTVIGGTRSFHSGGATQYFGSDNSTQGRLNLTTENGISQRVFINTAGGTNYFFFYSDQNDSPYGYVTKSVLLSNPSVTLSVNGINSYYRKLDFIGSFPAGVRDALSKGTLLVTYAPAPSGISGAQLNAIRWQPSNPSLDYPSAIIGEDGFLYVDDNWLQTITEKYPTSDAFYVIFYTNYLLNPVPALSSIFSPGDELPNIVISSPNTDPYKVEEFTDNFHPADVEVEISALPFRAYEQIYNAFYRDDRNNPYYVNGTYDPNIFLPTTKGGVDDNAYVLHRRNWEQDFLTTCQPSPQFGVAPLVGITSRGVATFQDADGVSYTSQLQTAEDGETIVGFSTTKNTSVNRTLVELASSGISINDLRGVNALQRFLETNIRRGLRYRDQILAHTGVEVGFDELDMPEFLGSVVTRVDVSQINQTTPSGDDPLGSYAGQLSAIGGGSKIQKFCDENGYIIGIISVTPVPCYSQLLPKHFLKVNEPLDFYDSAFAYLGMQPVRYNEVCPLQAMKQNTDVNTTFGYQRAWYDYMSSTDEVHGQFRTTLNHFVMSRVFNQLPSLNPDFLTIDPSAINDVFSVSSYVESDGTRVPIDTILGQIHFDLAAERRIPRYGVPRLE